jgi:hypothetical protein
MCHVISWQLSSAGKENKDGSADYKKMKKDRYVQYVLDIFVLISQNF